jgi:hypothetical protein
MSDSAPQDLNQDLQCEPSFINIMRTEHNLRMKSPPSESKFLPVSEIDVEMMVIKPNVPTILHLLAYMHPNLQFRMMSEI